MKKLSAAAAHEIKDVRLQSFWQCIQSMQFTQLLGTPPGNYFLCRCGCTSTAPMYLNE